MREPGHLVQEAGDPFHGQAEQELLRQPAGYCPRIKPGVQQGGGLPAGQIHADGPARAAGFRPGAVQDVLLAAQDLGLVKLEHLNVVGPAPAGTRGCPVRPPAARPA